MGAAPDRAACHRGGPCGDLEARRNHAAYGGQHALRAKQWTQFGRCTLVKLYKRLGHTHEGLIQQMLAILRRHFFLVEIS